MFSGERMSFGRYGQCRLTLLIEPDTLDQKKKREAMGNGGCANEPRETMGECRRQSAVDLPPSGLLLPAVVISTVGPQAGTQAARPRRRTAPTTPPSITSYLLWPFILAP